MIKTYQNINIKYDEHFQENVKKMIDFDFITAKEYIVSIIFINTKKMTQKEAQKYIPDFVYEIDCSLYIVNKKSGDDNDRILILIEELQTISDELFDEIRYQYVVLNKTVSEIKEKYRISVQKIRYIILKEYDEKKLKYIR